MSDNALSESVVSSSPNNLDQLIGLSEEISALVKTGLPLEESLLIKSQAERGKIGEHLRQLAERLGTGRSLADAVRNDPVFPPVFATVVESGIKTGNLSGSLDSLTECIRSLRDARLFLLRSTLYPLVLFTTLWFVFAFLVVFIAPRFVEFFDSYHQPFALIEVIHYLTANDVAAWAFTFGLPVLTWVLYFVWTIRSAKSDVIQSIGNSTLFRYLPWVGRAAIEMQKTAFARIFALLVRSSLPLDQAILLAAKSCNERYWSRDSLEALQQRRIVDGKANAYWYLGVPLMMLIGLALLAYLILQTDCIVFRPWGLRRLFRSTDSAKFLLVFATGIRRRFPIPAILKMYAWTVPSDYLRRKGTNIQSTVESGDDWIDAVCRAGFVNGPEASLGRAHK
jgi:type II secretory pathway component PulF